MHYASIVNVSKVDTRGSWERESNRASECVAAWEVVERCVEGINIKGLYCSHQREELECTYVIRIHLHRIHAVHFQVCCSWAVVIPNRLGRCTEEVLLFVGCTLSPWSITLQEGRELIILDNVFEETRLGSWRQHPIWTTIPYRRDYRHWIRYHEFGILEIRRWKMGRRRVRGGEN